MPDDINDFLDEFLNGQKPKQEPEPKKEDVKTPVSEQEIIDLDASVEEVLDAIDLGGSQKPKVELKPEEKSEENLDALSVFMDNSGLERDREVPDIMYPWMKHHTFTRVESVAQVNQIVDECIKRKFCSLDLECEGLDNRIIYKDGKPETVHKIVGYCISYDGEEGFYIPVRHQPADGGPNLNVSVKEVDEAISRLCHAAIPEGTPEAIKKDPLSYKVERPAENPNLVIAFWNAQFDQEFLYPVTGIDWWHPDSFEDGMLAAFTVFAGAKRFGLKAKSKELLHDPDGNPYEMIELKELFFGKTKNIRFQTLAPDEPGVLRYTGSDAICTYKLCTIPDLVPRCHAKHAVTYKIEKQTTCVVRVMERNRVRIEREAVRETLAEQEKKREQIYGKIQKFAKANGRSEELDPNSPKQLSSFLFGPAPKGLDISPKPDKNIASGQYKTDADTLERLAKAESAPPILKDIVKFREVEKFIGTYLLGLANNPDENDELRVSFKQTGAASGRFSAPAGNPEHGYSGIPVHGIPNGSDVRRVFIARPGYTMIKADYAGEELRIAANVSGESVWIHEFLQGSGDLHSITARALFGKKDITKKERSAGKTANFSLLYGGGPRTIVRATGCSEVEARRRKQAFDKAVPTFASWIKSQHKRVKKELGVYTAFGRWLPIPDANSDENKVRAACERYSVNYVIQGSGADIMKIAMIRLHKIFHEKGWLKNGGDDSIRMLLTVHDEVVFEVRHDLVAEAVPIIVSKMEMPWRMPTTPPWKVPLVVEPLIGFNWGSGYDARRVPKDYKPKGNEVVLNGFVYSTVRQPRVNDKGDVVEPLDQNEVQDGKVFRIVDAPWLMGHKPGSVSNIVSETPETPKLEMKPEPEVESKNTTEPKTESKIEAKPQIESKTEVEKPVAEAETLVLSINQLNEQTVQQVFDAIMDSLMTEGVPLHLTDIVGTTLVPSSLPLSPDMTLEFKVNKEKLMAHLQEHNLIP